MFEIKFEFPIENLFRNQFDVWPREKWKQKPLTCRNHIQPHVIDFARQTVFRSPLEFSFRFVRFQNK